MKPIVRFDASRRMFLGHGAAFGALAGVGAPLALNLAAMGNAAAQSAGDYRALVCIFLFGGNDAYNMVLPTDATPFANYTAVRNQAPDSIALLAPGTAVNPAAAAGSPAWLGGVLPINASNLPGVGFGLHPLMGSLQTLFNSDRRLAVVANVGPLLRPTSKVQYVQSTHPKPQSLFSHNDQQNTWQALGPEGATHGWGGRLADMLVGMNSKPIFTAVSTSGTAVWLAGAQVRQYQVSTGGATRMGVDGGGRVYGSEDVGAAMKRIVARATAAHVLERDLAAVSARSRDAEAALAGALKPASDPLFGTAPASGTYYNAYTDPRLMYANPLTGASAANPLAQQLQIVARLIDAAGNVNVGANRQVFFVSMGGFDTHDSQNRSQADLMARLAHGLSYFDATLGLMGARSRVTTFTASDFGRTLTSNGDGTDHGWGSHHLVMGGAVDGGKFFGTFPVLGVKNANDNNFNSNDQLDNGALLPSTAVDQMGATLGRWFGASDSQLLDVFPNLAQFNSSNIGFML